MGINDKIGKTKNMKAAQDCEKHQQARSNARKTDRVELHDFHNYNNQQKLCTLFHNEIFNKLDNNH